MIGMHTITVGEEERQAMIIALAHLALERPGWDGFLSGIALKMDNRTGDDKPEMFEEFKRLHVGGKG